MSKVIIGPNSATTATSAMDLSGQIIDSLDRGFTPIIITDCPELVRSVVEALACSMTIVGNHTAKTINLKSTLEALKMAVRNPKEPYVIISDQRITCGAVASPFVRIYAKKLHITLGGIADVLQVHSGEQE